MAQQNIGIGAANAGEGDDYFTAFTKTQANFTELFGLVQTSVVVVNQATLAATLGATIDSSKAYIIDGVVDFTGTGLNIKVPAGGINLVGYTFESSQIICSDINYTLFTSEVGGSGDILGRDYAIDISGTGSQVYNLTDATGANAFEFSRINYNNCSSLGIITGYRQGLESGTGRFGGQPELTLAGTWAGGYFIDASIVRSLIDGAYTLFKAGAAFSMASRFRSNHNIDLPASASFLDFTPANFVNASTLQLEDCLISRSGIVDAGDANLTPNIAAADLASAWKGNNGLPNTFVGGELTVGAEIATTITVASTFVDLAGTFTADDIQHFDSPANGQLRHLGSSPVEYSVAGQLVLESTANDEIDVKVVIFRSATTSFDDGKTVRRVVNNLQGGRNVAFFSLSDNITLNKDDYVKLEVANVAATNDITAELDSFFLVRAR